ncbi:prolipoprotein diacylglyceryl transferase [Motiliproteus sediminis]|uniref:prolipoprotein diacylglyceryl transferase n=1 Tax=Motiliproteus sediminis TaxID=1468178 RepID=UPI001AEF375F|nr:prolipoprotein diacylglyceryl transferase [Motiliproteus sediminis]
MLTYPHIDPVALELGPLKIHWYGLMYLGGFAAAWWLAKRRAQAEGSGWSREQVSDLIFYCALGVVLGGRLGYVLFYNFERFLAEPLWLFAVWEGGMAFHGGLLGVTAAILWFARKQHKDFFAVTDFVAPLVPIGLGLGRLGNFIGGELWGRATDLPWAMVFPRADALARHPSQLYQFALEGVVLFSVLWWFSSRPRPAGSVAGLFLTLYGCFRFLVEFVREPDQQLGYIAFDWLTMGQLLSLPMVIGGVVLIGWAYQGRGKNQGA